MGVRGPYLTSLCILQPFCMLFWFVWLDDSQGTTLLLEVSKCFWDAKTIWSATSKGCVTLASVASWGICQAARDWSQKSGSSSSLFIFLDELAWIALDMISRPNKNLTQKLHVYTVHLYIDRLSPCCSHLWHFQKVNSQTNTKPQNITAACQGKLWIKLELYIVY